MKSISVIWRSDDQGGASVKDRRPGGENRTTVDRDFRDLNFPKTLSAKVGNEGEITLKLGVINTSKGDLT